MAHGHYVLFIFLCFVNFFQESEFLKNALMIPWTLSTSQQPQQQIESSPNCSNPKYQDKVSPVLSWNEVEGHDLEYPLNALSLQLLMLGNLRHFHSKEWRYIIGDVKTVFDQGP